MTTHKYDDQVIIPAIGAQLDMWGVDESLTPVGVYFECPEVDLDSYDHIVVCHSGGKDGWAAFLSILESGVDRSKIELWHHDVDGREGSSLMDWLFMADYNRKLAEAFGVPLYFSWLEGGFEGEMLKHESFSKPHVIETPDGVKRLERNTTRAKPGTRRRFPQVSMDLQTRWCSGALKIDVGRRAINNQERFNRGRTLFITGERREESSGRAKYNQLEPHFCDRRSGKLSRHVDHWRPVLHWSEEEVWAILERHRVIPPVPYRLGWGRSSCMTCIYNGPRIWATMREYFPERVRAIQAYEHEFKTTISRDRIDVVDIATRGKPLEIDDAEALEQAMKTEYTLPIMLPEGQRWQIPKGAFGVESCGAD
ncbi:MAG: phosphoadenosine phosphosulfate reductase family protein [Natronospirillum sp.]|uniref:phosphoadenosine phosphosulfate reductase domain-containing protein n=1 Tax=Natronospirillum sp. TaxID=2812955 RepID=UPI0025D3C5C0|nr:phosphoadenosine phosphosulfate reductase family protein [Natronospirillum sp.]MCH8552504.1 phosphoadenosine phosphosulfate reductase family protein [Natronospirillum sp.]